MSGFTIELVDPEGVLLREIPDKKREDVALTYAMALGSSEVDEIDWSKINHAIIERWSIAGLKWIKTRAWKLVEQRTLAQPPEQEAERIDHYAIVHDAIVAALKVESRESVEDAVDAGFDTYGDYEAERDALREGLRQIAARPCTGIGSPPSCACRTCIAERALSSSTEDK